VISDEEIETALSPLRPLTYSKVPIEGQWRRPPFENRQAGERTAAILCTDPGIATLTVDRHSGEVILLDEDGTIHPR
jgi:hypothetical protein